MSLMSSFELPPEEPLPLSNPAKALNRTNDLHTKHARQYYEREMGRVVVKELSLTTAVEVQHTHTDITSSRLSMSTHAGASNTPVSDEADTLKFIHGAIVRALENPSNPFIVEAALAALDDIDRHGSLWAGLDELLVHTNSGHGARSMEASLRKIRSQSGTPSESHHLQLALRSTSKTHTHWVVSPKYIPPGQSPPLVLDLHGTPLPDYCLYIQAHGRDIQKAWMWTPGQGWKEVKQGERHPQYTDRILRLDRSDRNARPSWPKEASMGSMRRRDKKKPRATTAP